MTYAIAMSDLFREMGHDYHDMCPDEPVDVANLGYEVMTATSDGAPSWSLIKTIVRKPVTDAYRIEEFDLNVSPLHKFWVKVGNSLPHWVEAVALTYCEDVQVMHQDRGWVPVKVIHTEEKIDILDVEVDGSHSYFSNGILSHNTMYGDPTTCPGGKAIPFHASLRLSITSGNPIRDKDNKVIGIHAIVTVKKNKVAPPWRKVEFDIIFGHGIVEDDYVFDVVRAHCDATGGVKRQGKLINVSGTSGWRNIHVSDLETGEVLVDRKFYKKDFSKLRKDPETKAYVDALIDEAYTQIYSQPVASDGEEVDSDE